MEYFLIARVEQLYGKNGFVRLKSYSDFPERFLNLDKVYIDFWGEKKTFYVEDVKDVNGKIVIKFKRFDSQRDSHVLIDRDVYVAEDDLIKLPTNQYFIHDLVGSEVIAGNEKIGTITDIIKSKANDVLVILTDDNEEKLMPFVLTYIEKFDAVQKKLILNVTKEFFEDDED